MQAVLGWSVLSAVRNHYWWIVLEITGFSGGDT